MRATRRDDRSPAACHCTGPAAGAPHPEPHTGFRPRQHVPERGRPQGRTSGRALHLDPGPAPACPDGRSQTGEKRTYKSVDRLHSFRDDPAAAPGMAFRSGAPRWLTAFLEVDPRPVPQEAMASLVYPLDLGLAARARDVVAVVTGGSGGIGAATGCWRPPKDRLMPGSGWR